MKYEVAQGRSTKHFFQKKTVITFSFFVIKPKKISHNLGDHDKSAAFFTTLVNVNKLFLYLGLCI